MTQSQASWRLGSALRSLHPSSPVHHEKAEHLELIIEYIGATADVNSEILNNLVFRNHSVTERLAAQAEEVAQLMGGCISLLKAYHAIGVTDDRRPGRSIFPEGEGILAMANNLHKLLLKLVPETDERDAREYRYNRARNACFDNRQRPSPLKF